MHTLLSGAAAPSRRPRAALIAVVSLLLSLGTANSAGALEPEDRSAALARLVDSSLFRSDTSLLRGISAASGYPSDAGEAASTTGIEIMESIEVEVRAGVPLLGSSAEPGILTWGEAGMLQAYAFAPDARNASASAGAVGDDGSVTLDTGSTDPYDSPYASVDLTPLLGELQIDGVVDSARLDFGAIASSARWTSTGGPVSEYHLADGRLFLRSPALQALGDDVRRAAGGAETLIQQSLTSQVGVQQLDLSALGLVDARVDGVTVSTPGLGDALREVSQALLEEPLQDSAGLVSVSLSNGAVEIDLARLADRVHGRSINDLPPNTELLPAEAVPVASTAIAEALQTMAVRWSETLDRAPFEIAFGVQASVPPLDLPLSGGTVTVRGALGDLAGTSGQQPVVEASPALLEVVDADELARAVTDQVVAPVSAVASGLLAGTPPGVPGSIRELADGTLVLLAPALTTVLDALVDVVVNEQPTEGDLGPGSLTVRAVSLTLLPYADALTVHLASSTVRVSEQTGAPPVPALPTAPEQPQPTPELAPEPTAPGQSQPTPELAPEPTAPEPTSEATPELAPSSPPGPTLPVEAEPSPSPQSTAGPAEPEPSAGGPSTGTAPGPSPEPSGTEPSLPAEPDPSPGMASETEGRLSPEPEAPPQSSEDVSAPPAADVPPGSAYSPAAGFPVVLPSEPATTLSGNAVGPLPTDDVGGLARYRFGSEGVLARTGTDVSVTTAAGSALLLLGAGVLWMARRRLDRVEQLADPQPRAGCHGESLSPDVGAAAEDRQTTLVTRPPTPDG